MKEDFISISFEAKDLSLIERCEEIYQIQSIICRSLDKRDWFFGIKKRLNLSDKALFTESLLQMFKSRIKKHTILRVIPDDFIDAVPSTVGFFGSDKYDDGLIIRYTLGATTPVNLSSIIIDNVSDIVNGDVEALKALLVNLSSRINMNQIVVPNLLMANQIREEFLLSRIVRTDFDAC